MPSDYEKIRNENKKEYGEGTKLSKFLARIYNAKHPFVNELLQNADDAKATKIMFQLKNDKLRVMHNGNDFTENDVFSICQICDSTKEFDETTIGRFGLGFKSVLTITKEPRIYTKTENFRIEKGIFPHPIEKIDIPTGWTTVVDLFFPEEDTDIENTMSKYNIVDRVLTECMIRNLLFLKNVCDVSINMHSNKLRYERCIINKDSQFIEEVRIKKTESNQYGSDDKSERWLIFTKETSSYNTSESSIFVQIAFRVEILNDKYTFEKLNYAPFYCTFPTDINTTLGFIVNAPFETTTTRDNLSASEENIYMMHCLSNLLIKVMEYMRDKHNLTIEFIKTLPINRNQIENSKLMQIMFNKVNESFIKERFLPTSDGKYEKSSNCKLARGQMLINLLDSKQLKQLFTHDTDVSWLDKGITVDNTPDIRSYLMYELDIEEIDPEKFINRLTDNFIEEQSDDWLSELYALLYKNQYLLKYTKGKRSKLLNCAFVRLEDNTHSKACDDNGKPIVYIKNSNILRRNVKVIKPCLVQDEESLNLFKVFLKVGEYNDADNVIYEIETRYKFDKPTVISKPEYLKDLSVLQDLLSTVGPEKIESTINKIKELPIILSTNIEKTCLEYKLPDQVYQYSDELAHYFENADDVWFACDEYSKNYTGLFNQLGIKQSPKKFINSIGYYEYHNLEAALNSIDTDKSVYIWNNLANQLSISICEMDTWSRHYGSVQMFKNILELLKNIQWVCKENDDQFYCPSELYESELCSMYSVNDSLIQLLGINKDDIKVLSEKIGISQEHIKIAKLISELSAEKRSEIIKIVMNSSADNKHTSFPSDNVENPEFLKSRIQEQFDNTQDLVKVHKMRTETKKDKKIIRQYLRSMYGDHDSLICQLCHKVMPFRGRDNLYYLVSTPMFRYETESKQPSYLHLSLCPNCHCKYQEYVLLCKENSNYIYSYVLNHTIVENKTVIIPLVLDENRNYELEFQYKHYLSAQAWLKSASMNNGKILSKE